MRACVVYGRAFGTTLALKAQGGWRVLVWAIFVSNFRSTVKCCVHRQLCWYGMAWHLGCTEQVPEPGPRSEPRCPGRAQQGRRAPGAAVLCCAGLRC